jgi:hypothetical protein
MPAKPQPNCNWVANCIISCAKRSHLAKRGLQPGDQNSGESSSEPVTHFNGFSSVAAAQRNRETVPGVVRRGLSPG